MDGFMCLIRNAIFLRSRVTNAVLCSNVFVLKHRYLRFSTEIFVLNFSGAHAILCRNLQ